MSATDSSKPTTGPSDTQFLAANLEDERRRLTRSLHRTGLFTALLLAVVGALTAMAIQQARTAEERLWRSLLDQARSARWSGRPGARAEALGALREASRRRSAPELRDEAIAALALDDLQLGGFTNLIAGRDTAIAVDTQLEQIALAEPDGSVRLRALWTDREERLLPGLDEPVHYLFFSPDDRWLIVRYESGRTRAWSVSDGKPGMDLVDCFRVTTSRGTVRFLPGMPDRCWLSDQEGHRLRLLDLHEGREIQRIPLEDVPGVIALAENGDIAVGVGREVQIWNPESSRLLHKESYPSTVSALEWRPGTRELAVATEGAHLELLNLDSGLSRPLPGHRALINAVRFDATGRTLFSTSWDGTTRFWDATMARAGLVTRDGLALHYDRAGKRLAFYRGNNGVGFWNVVHSPVLATLAAPPSAAHHFTDLALSPDGHHVAAVNRQMLLVWNLPSRRLLIQQPLPGGEGVAWSPDGSELATASERGLTRWLFDPDPLQWLELPGSRPSPTVNGRFHRVAPGRIAASADGAAWWMEPWRGGEVAPVQIPDESIDTFAHVTAHPDGRLVGSRWKGGATRVLPMREGDSGKELEPVGGFARFSPDGSTLLTGNNRGYRLWRSDDWQVVGELDQQIGSDFPGLAVYAPDGSAAFLIHGHQRVALAALPDLRLRVSFEAPGNPNLYAMDLDATGDRLLVGTDDQRVLVWHLDVLRRELTALGIPDWDQSSPAQSPPGVPLWAAAAFFLVLTLALHTLWRQRVLVRDHLRIESLVADRNQQLLRAREELLHGHKMQALGQLTAGVAHDLRNLLSVISLSNGLLRRGVQGNSDLSEEAEAVDGAVERGRTLVLSLLGYSSRTNSDSAETVVSRIVDDLLRMLGRKFLSGIKVELTMTEGLTTVAMPAPQLEQILLNLFVNASEAMGHAGTLKVRVDTGKLPTGPDWVVARPGQDTSGVLVSVSDTGPGIPEEVRPRIFEPFFTTKSRGASVGTGLGLSMVYAIAERHGAGLAVRSAPGATEFVLWLPKVN